MDIFFLQQPSRWRWRICVGEWCAKQWAKTDSKGWTSSTYRRPSRVTYSTNTGDDAQDTTTKTFLRKDPKKNRIEKKKKKKKTIFGSHALRRFPNLTHGRKWRQRTEKKTLTKILFLKKNWPSYKITPVDNVVSASIVCVPFHSVTPSPPDFSYVRWLWGE